jgi:DNA-3-methyladenine glycosylase II
MTRFELEPRGPFSLAAGAAFLEGFAPAAHRAADAGHLHLAFVPDGEEAAAGVCLRQPGTNVVGEAFGDADPAAVRDQVARILSLDVDGGGFPEAGATRWSASCRTAGPGCGRSASSRPTRRRRGR